MKIFPFSPWKSTTHFVNSEKILKKCRYSFLSCPISCCHRIIRLIRYLCINLAKWFRIACKGIKSRLFTFIKGRCTPFKIKFYNGTQAPSLSVFKSLREVVQALGSFKKTSSFPSEKKLIEYILFSLREDANTINLEEIQNCISLYYSSRKNELKDSFQIGQRKSKISPIAEKIYQNLFSELCMSFLTEYIKWILEKHEAIDLSLSRDKSD